MRELHFLPWQIDAMTLSEITLCLERAEDRKPRQSLAEIQAHLAAWRALTPRQRLLSRRASP